MKKDFSTPPGNTDAMQHPHPSIAVFKAEQQEYGFRITTAGRYTLQPPVNLPDCVIGTLDLAGQQVPVIRPKSTSQTQADPITSQSCIVLFEHRISRAAILTGRLFDNVSQVFDLITELSDMPNRTELLYTCFEESLAPTQSDPQDPLRMQDNH